MTEFIPPTEARKGQPDFNSLSEFVQGYLTAAFWTDCNADNPELESMGYADIPESELADIIADCEDFQNKARENLRQAYGRDYSESRAGHDFWLTRNGHGAGYWDRDELDADGLGDRLTTIAERFGNVDLMAGDDGKLYFS